MSIEVQTKKLNTIKDLVNQFTNGIIKYPFQLEKKVAKVLGLQKGYSQELYYEHLNSLSSQIFQFELNNGVLP